MTEQQHEPAEEWLSQQHRGLPGDDAQLRDLRAKLDETGVAELRDFLTPEAHELLKSQILELESAAAAARAAATRSSR